MIKILELTFIYYAVNHLGHYEKFETNNKY